MEDKPITGQSYAELVSRRGGLREEDLARADPHVREALTENKHHGLWLAVRARWIALAIIAVLLFFLNDGLDVLYYHAGLALFALIGWAQLRAGKVAQSGRELLLILCDIALLTFLFVVPSPFRDETWPAAFQYQLIEFSYFYVLLAAATLAYSWRTVVAFGTWTAGFWLIALLLIVLFGAKMPELSERAANAFAGYDAIIWETDPKQSSGDRTDSGGRRLPDRRRYFSGQRPPQHTATLPPSRRGAGACQPSALFPTQHRRQHGGTRPASG